jgi:hypothetical protein
MMWQLDHANRDALVILGRADAKPLFHLLPNPAYDWS